MWDSGRSTHLPGVVSLAKSLARGWPRCQHVGMTLARPTPRDGLPAARANASRLMIGATVAVVVVLGVAGWPGWWWRPGAGELRPGALAGLLASAEALALLAWRRAPVACFAVAEAALVTYALLSYPPTPASYAGLVATGVGAWGPRRTLVRYGCLIVALGGIVAIGVGHLRADGGAGIVINAALVVVAWLVGRTARTHQRTAALRADAAHEAALRDAAELRLGLAATLHDRVGHTLVGVLRQLEAAQVLGDGGGQVLIERASTRLRDAMGEITALVAATPLDHHSAMSVPLTSRRSLAVFDPRRLLGNVVATWSDTLVSSGMSVSLSLCGTTDALAPSSEELLAGAVAEALANVARHSDANRVEIGFVFSSDTACVSVSDPGPARADSTGAGTGLRRLRQALSVVGGQLLVGPAGKEGFCFEAHVPVVHSESLRAPRS